jgi:hypothetical protein
MKRQFALLAAALIAVSSVACASTLVPPSTASAVPGASSPTLAPRPSPEPTTTLEPVSPAPGSPPVPSSSASDFSVVLDRTWSLGILTGMPAYVAITRDSNITIRFDREGRAGGSGGCNDIGGPYKVTGNQISIEDGPHYATWCGDDIGNREDAVRATLLAVTTWHVSSLGWLYLEGPNSRPTMVWHPLGP